MHIARLCSASLLAFAVAGSASAADLAPLKAPPVVGFNWTSCYGGGFLGGARSGGDMTVTDLGNSQFRSYSGGLVAGRVENQHSWNLGSASNFIGGITAGCNWQPVGSPWVVGIEGETGYLKVERTAADPLRSPSLSAVSPDVLATGNVGNWYGMITGRLGYAWDRTLLYVKGGAAFVQARAAVNDFCLTTATGCGNWAISTLSVDQTLTTWTAGGGLEWAIFNNWSIKAEYMFIGLGDKSITTCAAATTSAGAPVPGGQFCFNHEFPGIHTAKIGLNYRFTTATF